MLILHAALTYPPHVDGVSEVVRQVSERLARRGHEVHVATSAVRASASLEVMNGVVVHRFEVRGNEVSGIYGEAAAYRRLVLSKLWDVIAFHSAQTWIVDSLLDQSFSANGVFVAHGLSAFNDPVYYAYFARLADWVGRGMIMVSISSTGLANKEFIHRFGLPDSIIIPNGVALEEWCGPTLQLRDRWQLRDRLWLVNVSNHNPAKGHNRLFELADTLKSTDGNIRVTQFGRSYPAAVYDLGRFGIKGGCWYTCSFKAPLQSVIELRPKTPRKEVVSAVREADLTVLTSNWEASPLVILESMAAGTPFVTFDVGCVREHVGGVVVDSVQEMSQVVRRLLSSPDIRRSLGAQGQARVKERHDWEVITSQYETLYRNRNEVRAQLLDEAK